MKAFISIFLVSFIGFAAVGQDYDFKVMMTSGTNKYMKKGSSDWEGLKNGTALFSGDKVNVGESGYLVLINSNGSYVELKTAGEKAIDDITMEAEKGLSGKYLGYVVSKMSAEEQEKNRKKYASVTGATERGFSAINVFMKSSSPVYNSDVVIRWTNMGSDKRYKITMEDLFDEVVHELESDKNYMSIDLNDKNLLTHQLISVRINVIGDENVTSEKYSIQRIEKDEFGKYKAELEELQSVLDKNSPMSHLIMAEFYESRKLLLDAATCYEHAIKISNGMDYFRQTYVQFLMRNGWSEVL